MIDLEEIDVAVLDVGVDVQVAGRRKAGLDTQIERLVPGDRRGRKKARGQQGRAGCT